MPVLSTHAYARPPYKVRHGLTFYVGIGVFIGFSLKLLADLVDEVWEPAIAQRLKKK